jgi:lipopolysaccharide export system protein LptA
MAIECNYAVHYQQQGRIVFENQVHYSDSLRNLWAQKVIYYIDTDSMEAIGSVKVLQNVYEGYCYRAYYSQERKNAYWERNVKLIHTEENIVLTGQKGFGDQSLEYAKVFITAQLVKYDSLGESEITIDADTVEYFHSCSFAQAFDSVKIAQKDITGDCQLLHYFVKDSKAEMLENPVVFRQAEEMKGDTIDIFFTQRKLDKLEIFGEASAFSPVEGGKEGEVNKMFGQQIFADIEEDKIKHITVVGNARSLYFLYEKGEFKGINRASGDKIYLTFKDGKLDIINVSGGSEGTFFPPDYKGEIE